MRVVVAAVAVASIVLAGCSNEPAEVTQEAVQTAKASLPLLVSVPELAGKTPEVVGNILGKPLSCEQTKYGEKCSFSKAGTEIVFINGKADWISINEMPEIPYNSSALTAIGFSERKPTFSNEYTIRWNNLPGYLEVSLAPGGNNKVSLAYVKVATK